METVKQMALWVG